MRERWGALPLGEQHRSWDLQVIAAVWQCKQAQKGKGYKFIAPKKKRHA